jgi:hypothetical protein
MGINISSSKHKIMEVLVERKLLKFKYKPKEDLVFIKYEQTRENDVTDTITLETSDHPRTELSDALQAMAEHLVDIIEAPAGWVGKLTISSVTVTWNSGIQGLVITGLRALQLSNSPMIINTPHFTRDSYNEDSESDKNIFSFNCGSSLDVLCDQVFKYVDGQRKQLTLNFEEGRKRVQQEEPKKVLEPVGTL